MASKVKTTDEDLEEFRKALPAKADAELEPLFGELLVDGAEGDAEARIKADLVDDELERRRREDRRRRLTNEEKQRRADKRRRDREKAERAHLTEELAAVEARGTELAPEGDRLKAALGEWLDGWLANRAEALSLTQRLGLAVHPRIGRYERDAAWLIRGVLSPKPPAGPRLRRHFERPPATFAAESFGDLAR